MPPPPPPPLPLKPGTEPGTGPDTRGAFVPRGVRGAVCAAVRRCAPQAILLSFSPDGLEWSAWQTIVNVTEPPGVPKGGQVTYPSLMSLDGPDNEVLGGTFGVVFQLRAGNASSPPFEFVSVNVTVAQ